MMHAGGLAQMSMMDSPMALPMSGGLASRRAGSKQAFDGGHLGLDNLSDTVAPPLTPRTSRAYMLAGLRTAPKTPTGPSPAPIQPASHMRQPSYGLPAILAPPTPHFEDGYSAMDPAVYAELMANGRYLAQQQQLLQQQLNELTLAQKQLQDHYPPSSLGYYNQQAQQGLQPIVTPVPGNPGLYTVYNPMTGQQSYFQDNLTSSPQLAHSPPPGTPTFHARVSPPPESNDPVRTYRSPSPSRMTAAAAGELAPLPVPSANAFRRGHSKQISSVSGFRGDTGAGSLGPGQGRAGEHPVRQPKGPPALEELMAKPTACMEGSKNFATQQRRQRSQALNGLARAGMERRGMSNIESPSITVEENHSGSSSRASSVPGVIGSERRRPKKNVWDVNALDDLSGKENGTPAKEHTEFRTSTPRARLVFTSADKRVSHDLP